MNILFIGDIVGGDAIKCVQTELPALKQRWELDFVVANAENVAGGLGLTSALAKRLQEAGVDVLTLGNHCWGKPELIQSIDQESCVLRPANGHPEWPGRGFGIFVSGGRRLAVVNLLGQVYMSAAQSPFYEAERILAQLEREKVRHVLIDFHAEASAEKMALAHLLAGRVSAVCGTHTHVQTADERILQEFTGYITDVGMTGPYNSIIGMQIESSIRRLSAQLPARYALAEGPVAFNGVRIVLDEISGACLRLERIALPARTY